MQHPRSSCAAWALLAFGLTGGRASVASAQHAPRALAPLATYARLHAEPTLDELRTTTPDRARLLFVEREASGGARRALAAARAMIEHAVVVRGSCATWLRAVYRRAGGRFSTVFNKDRERRYADRSQLRPGDWVRFVNYSYHRVGHSALFVGWAAPSGMRALTVSYTGRGRASPGRFHTYDLRSVYQIDRMQD